MITGETTFAIGGILKFRGFLRPVVIVVTVPGLTLKAAGAFAHGNVTVGGVFAL